MSQRGKLTGYEKAPDTVQIGGRDPRRAYRFVDAFEAELADYTGAPFAVAVNSCTNALFLALTWKRKQHGDARLLQLPKCTYIGVLQAALNAGIKVRWDNLIADWQDFGYYPITPTGVTDSARRIAPNMYRIYAGNSLVCLSFHAAKQLPIGRGGAILTDNPEAAEWFRAARMDGRPPGSSAAIFPGWHMPMPPDAAARGLDILSRWNDTGYTPPPLPPTDYPDLSQLWKASTPA